jgi:hypothetical protein
MLSRILLLSVLLAPLGHAQAPDPVKEAITATPEVESEKTKPKTDAPPPWYEQVTGILAIPVAVLTPFIAYVVLKKSRLESRKTELEILEKERTLGLAEGNKEAPAGSVSAAMPYIVSSLILRYILLELTLSLMNLLTEPLKYAFTGIGYGSYLLLRNVNTNSTASEVATFMFAEIGSIAGSVLYWAVLIILGWPLFKDVLRFFNISLQEFRLAKLWEFMRNWRTLSQQVNDTSQKNEGSL